jgi:hypothetical protein
MGNGDLCGGSDIEFWRAEVERLMRGNLVL